MNGLSLLVPLRTPGRSHDVVIVLCIKIALDNDVWLEFSNFCCQRCPCCTLLMTSWRMRFARKKDLMIWMNVLKQICWKLKNEKAAQRVSFGAGYPADVQRGYPGGSPGTKTSVKPSKSWKNKHFGADVHDPKARTSMTPEGFKKNFRQKNFGLNFRSLEMAWLSSSSYARWRGMYS